MKLVVTEGRVIYDIGRGFYLTYLEPGRTVSPVETLWMQNQNYQVMAKMYQTFDMKK